MKRVLFLCTGNVCRSPMAEALFRELVKARGDYEVVSAGISAWDGQPPSPESQQVLRELGIDISHQRSNMLTPEMAAEATHIFGMTRGHLQAVHAYFPEAADKAYLVTEFAAQDALRGRDVPDPIGMGVRVYAQTRDVLRAVLPSLREYIDQTFKSASPTPSPSESKDVNANANANPSDRPQRLALGAD
ncbi:MAG: low molecular weight protein arginine phosphatase [Verrucomicrobiales bacterium]